VRDTRYFNDVGGMNHPCTLHKNPIMHILTQNENDIPSMNLIKFKNWSEL
jgi:hypothetical protein